jgi:hypothetical protein
MYSSWKQNRVYEYSISPLQIPTCYLMSYIFRAVNYYRNLLIKRSTAQLHLYTLRHVSATTIRPYSGRMYKHIVPEDGQTVAAEICRRV